MGKYALDVHMMQPPYTRNIHRVSSEPYACVRGEGGRVSAQETRGGERERKGAEREREKGKGGKSEVNFSWSLSLSSLSLLLLFASLLTADSAQHSRSVKNCVGHAALSKGAAKRPDGEARRGDGGTYVTVAHCPFFGGTRRRGRRRRRREREGCRQERRCGCAAVGVREGRRVAPLLEREGKLRPSDRCCRRHSRCWGFPRTLTLSSPPPSSASHFFSLSLPPLLR